MASDGNRGIFAAVAAAKRELRTETIVVTRADVEEAKFLDLEEGGEDVFIELPVFLVEGIDARSVLFRCVEGKRNQVRCPTTEEMQLVF